MRAELQLIEKSMHKYPCERHLRPSVDQVISDNMKMMDNSHQPAGLWANQSRSSSILTFHLVVHFPFADTWIRLSSLGDWALSW